MRSGSCRCSATSCATRTFPEAELERERQVLLHEYIEDEDDPLSIAFRLFDKICYGTHPLAQPVIGSRANIEHLTRADLLGYVQRQYSGANIVVGIAGNVDPDAMVEAAQAAFGVDGPRQRKPRRRAGLGRRHQGAPPGRAAARPTSCSGSRSRR